MVRKWMALLIAVAGALGLILATPATAHASQPWGACGVTSSADKLVTNYHRSLGVPFNGGGIVGSGTTTFKCGTTGWGYRHILYKNHDDEFKAMALGTNQSWQYIADLGMAKALSDPDRVSYNSSKDTYCYSASVNLYRGSTFVRSQIVIVIIGEGNWNIITGYPSTSGQCQASQNE